MFPQKYEGAIPRRKRCLSLIVRVRSLHRGGILGVESQRIKSNHWVDTVYVHTCVFVCACAHVLMGMWRGGGSYTAEKRKKHSGLSNSPARLVIQTAHLVMPRTWDSGKQQERRVRLHKEVRSWRALWGVWALISKQQEAIKGFWAEAGHGLMDIKFQLGQLWKERLERGRGARWGQGGNWGGCCNIVDA